jgi:hypothetical protein
LKSLLFITAFILFACASNPTPPPQALVARPEFANEIAQELKKEVSSSHCQIIGCVAFEKEPNHYICVGEFSFILPNTAAELFRNAIDRARSADALVDFTAEEGFGSKMVGALLGGVAGGLASGAMGSTHSYYGGAASSSPVQFTASNNTGPSNQQ